VFSAIEILTRLLRQPEGRRYVLFLGNGASISSGVPPWDQIIKSIVREEFEITGVTSYDEYLKYFYFMMEALSEEDKSALLNRYIGGRRPSIGYQCLAKLIKAKYFRFILTTNFDPYLEEALLDAGLRQRTKDVNGDFDVLIVGVDRDDDIRRRLRSTKPKIKIIKLHGDIGRTKALVTAKQISPFTDIIEKVLKTFFSRYPVIIFGYSMSDFDILRCIKMKGPPIWYINLNRPAESAHIMQIMRSRGCEENIISGAEADFDRFFYTLAKELGVELPPIPLPPTAHRLIKEQKKYKLGADKVPYLSRDGMQRLIDYEVVRALPSTAIDFKDYVKLRVYIKFNCPICLESKKETPIQCSFDVGLSDKFNGFCMVSCGMGHDLIISKRLQWIMDKEV
jgi:NAD-dependent SIR2 family protein deacetylase